MDDILGLCHQLNDVLARHEGPDEEAAETHRRDQEFRALVENGPDAITRFDRDLRCLYANPARSRLLGMSQADPVGLFLEQIPLLADVATRRRDAIMHVFSGGQEVAIDYGLETPDGYRHYHERIVPELTTDGTIETVLAVARDITDLHEAQAQVARERDAADLQRRRLRAVLDALPVGVFIADAGGRVLAANAEVRRIWGEAPLSESPELYDHDYPARWPDTGRPVQAYEWGLARAMETGEAVSAEEVEIETASGERRTILNYALPIRDASGAIIGGVAVNVDYTEQKRGHRRLRELTEELEQRVEERTAEVTSRSEQLRALVEELETVEQRERQRLAQVLHDHLQQLLVAARYRVNAVQHERPGCDQLAEIDGLLGQSVAMTRSLSVEMDATTLLARGMPVALSWLMAWMYERHGISVDVHLDDAGDPVREDLRLLLFQAARELVFNVVKHAGVDRAELRTERDGDCLVLTVRDEGRGFEASPAAIRGESGPGLGLPSLSRRLSIAGGSLEVDASTGHGTRVTVRMPVAPETGERSQQVAPAAKPGG